MSIHTYSDMCVCGYMPLSLSTVLVDLFLRTLVWLYTELPWESVVALQRQVHISHCYPTVVAVNRSCRWKCIVSLQIANYQLCLIWNVLGYLYLQSYVLYVTCFMAVISEGMAHQMHWAGMHRFIGGQMWKITLILFDCLRGYGTITCCVHRCLQSAAPVLLSHPQAWRLAPHQQPSSIQW